MKVSVCFEIYFELFFLAIDATLIVLYLYPNIHFFLFFTGTQKDLEAFKKKTAELSEKLTERVRQYQKLQSLYEALKRKCISPSFFERQTVKEKSRAPSFVMSTASGETVLH